MLISWYMWLKIILLGKKSNGYEVIVRRRWSFSSRPGCAGSGDDKVLIFSLVVMEEVR